VKVTDKKQENNPMEALISAEDMIELKRDMQNAKVTEWVQKNQQQLIAGAVVFVLLLAGFSLWKEQKLAEKNAAALVYLKAINATDGAEQKALLDSVNRDYAETGYATLAKLKQATSGDSETRVAALKALIAGHSAPELIWQSRLDLAALYIAEGKADEAKLLLEERCGKSYEQLRYYLLSRIATDQQEKAELIQKSLDAESNDNDLAAELETELALLRSGK